jgi:hypothetical protein
MSSPRGPSILSVYSYSRSMAPDYRLPRIFYIRQRAIWFQAVQV